MKQTDGIAGNTNELPTGSQKENDQIPTYKWDEYDNFTFKENANAVYEKIIFWKIENPRKKEARKLKDTNIGPLKH